MNVQVNQLSPLGVYEEGMAWNAVEKVIMERRSIRGFKKEPLPDSMIKSILEAGRFAPSAGNMQPWRFIVVKSPEMLAELERDAVRFVKLLMFFLDYTRGGCLRRIMTKLTCEILYTVLPNELPPGPVRPHVPDRPGKNEVFHDAPTLILLVEDRRGVSCPRDRHRHLRPEHGARGTQPGRGKLLDRPHQAVHVLSEVEKKIRHQVSVPAQRMPCRRAGRSRRPTGSCRARSSSWNGMIAASRTSPDTPDRGNDMQKVKYSFFDRMRIPDYDSPKQMKTGDLNFDRALCKQCGVCIQLCPGGCLLTDTATKIGIISGVVKGGKYGVPSGDGNTHGRHTVCRVL